MKKFITILVCILVLLPNIVYAKPKLTDQELLYVSRAIQGECESVYNKDKSACYGIALSIYNRYNKGYGSIINIVQSSYYGYKNVKTPDPLFVQIALDSLEMEDFTNGSVYAFSYPADVKYLGISNSEPTYKAYGIWFYNYWPIGKTKSTSKYIHANDKAISLGQCIKIGQCVSNKVKKLDE